jgi:hypothetical protein
MKGEIYFYFSLKNKSLCFFLLFNKDLPVELSFTLTRPKLTPTSSSSRQLDQHVTDVPINHNLIQLDANFVYLSFLLKFHFS